VCTVAARRLGRRLRKFSLLADRFTTPPMMAALLAPGISGLLTFEAVGFDRSADALETEVPDHRSISVGFG